MIDSYACTYVHTRFGFNYIYTDFMLVKTNNLNDIVHVQFYYEHVIEILLDCRKLPNRPTTYKSSPE